MANQTVYPYGTVGNLPSSIGLVQDLVTGGADKALSAEVGKSAFHDVANTSAAVESNYYHIDFSISPENGKWYEAGTGQGSKLITLPSNLKSIILKPTSDVMLWSFLSAYSTPSNGSTASIASGTENRYSATEETEVTAWGNAKFLCVRDDTASTDAKFPEITFLYDLSRVKDEMDGHSRDISELSLNTLSSVDQMPFGSLEAGYVQDDGTWLKMNSDNTHFSAHYNIAVVAGRLYRINAGSIDAVAYWATSNAAAVNGQDAPITGSKLVVKAGESRVFRAPTGATYMLVMAVYYNSTLAPSSVEYVSNGGDSMLDVIPEYLVSGEQMVDISSLTESTGTMQGGGTWYTTKGKHKAMPVTPGDKYVIQGDGKGFWAWLSGSYSTPVTQGASVPFATGYTNRVLQKDAVAVTVPESAAYLVFTTVNGSGTSSSWKIWKVSSYERRSVDMAKLRMAHWNIGQFVYTDWTVGDPTHTIPAADAATYAQKYRQLIDSVGADIFGVAEYNPKFSAANWDTKDVIFQCFSRIYEATKTGANCNSIFANIMEWVGKEEISFPASSYNRYYTHITARFMGENIHIVEAHLDHTYNEMRVAEITQLIADMSPYKYVIIGGDFNTGDEETVETEYGAFKTAGYTMLNSDYLGLVITSLTQEYVDNIIVKGFTMANRQTSESSGTLSDHLLLSCDLIMQF